VDPIEVSRGSDGKWAHAGIKRVGGWLNVGASQEMSPRYKKGGRQQDQTLPTPQEFNQPSSSTLLTPALRSKRDQRPADDEEGS